MAVSECLQLPMVGCISESQHVLEAHVGVCQFSNDYHLIDHMQWGIIHDLKIMRVDWAYAHKLMMFSDGQTLSKGHIEDVYSHNTDTVLPSLMHLVWDSLISDASHVLPPHGGNLVHFPPLINNSVFNVLNVLLLWLHDTIIEWEMVVCVLIQNIYLAVVAWFLH